ncbi:MAG TPA: hypothetical protein VEL31_21980 [Ktedonobacteraceae bacterium]|nr:hypothetical protein [Ktedonobacteraceae bacterium]
MVKHASAFTQANDLAWNPQTLFRCQGTTHLFSRTMQKTESNGAFIPFPKGQGVFPRRFDNLIYHKGLPSIRVGNVRRVHPGSLQDWMKRCEQQTA